jgi:hypothetical protein
MIPLNREIYFNNYYFFLKEKEKNYTLYFSNENNLNEARKKDEFVKLPKNKLKSVVKYIEDILKKKKKKNTKEIKTELEELINSDGSMSNSRVPIYNPNISPKNTTDQTVSAARITNDPITRGYRTYYGESIEEIDMSKAFGYEETEDMDGKETYEFLVKKMDMEPDDAKDRTKQQGKDPSGKKDKRSKYYKDKNFITKATLSEIQKEKMIKMLEDILVNKNKKSEVLKKKTQKEKEVLPKMITKNIKSLMKQAQKHGIDKADILKLISDE